MCVLRPSVRAPVFVLVLWVQLGPVGVCSPRSVAVGGCTGFLRFVCGFVVERAPVVPHLFARAHARRLLPLLAAWV